MSKVYIVSMVYILLEPHSSFRFQYRLFTMTTFFETAVYYAKSILTVINHLGLVEPHRSFRFQYRLFGP